MVGVPAYRLFFSYACKFVLTNIFPIKGILDYSIFYRGYRGELIRKAMEKYGDKLFETKGFVGIPELLIKQLKARGLDPNSFEFYINAFRTGAPPHAGWSVGIERLTMQICRLNNIREASLFPRDRHRLTP